MNRPRRLTERQVALIIADLNLSGRVAAYLDTFGPLVWRKPEGISAFDGSFRGAARFREIVILTRVGPLGISVYDDWIACVFDDAEAASTYGATYPSGKWNHHAFIGYHQRPTSREDMTRKFEAMFRRFVDGVERVTLRRPVDAIMEETAA